jgi:hypothetical protein
MRGLLQGLRSKAQMNFPLGEAASAVAGFKRYDALSELDIETNGGVRGLFTIVPTGGVP